MKSSLKFNPFDPEFHRDPYPTYHALRQEEPVSWSFWGSWILTRYDDIKAVLGDPRFHSLEVPKSLENKSRYLQPKQKNLDSLVQTTRHFLFFLNPPDHTKLRRLVSKVLPPEAWQSKKSLIQQLADASIDRVQARGSMDAIADFARWLPGQTIAYLLGLPAEDWPQLHQWSMGLSRLLDPMLPLDVCEGMNRIALAFSDYLRQQVARRRRQPTSDWMAALLEVEDRGDRLSEGEVISLCIMLFIAGEHTTLSLLGSGLLALLRHPDQLALLQRQPELMPQAVEEMLRYDSPIQLLARVAFEPVTLGGKNIAAGESLTLCLGAANRDPAQFPDPDRFDISRSQNRHLAFAGGLHFCLGAGLARLEVPIALQALLQRLPGLALAADRLVWQDSIVLRLLESLPVTFTAK